LVSDDLGGKSGVYVAQPQWRFEMKRMYIGLCCREGYHAASLQKHGNLIVMRYCFHVGYFSNLSESTSFGWLT